MEDFKTDDEFILLLSKFQNTEILKFKNCKF